MAPVTVNRLTLCAALAVLVIAAPARAQEARFLPAEDHPRWSAIGRLNVTGYRATGMCTATLIAPDRVLTAAHCVVTDTGAPIPADRLRFVAGWFRGDHAAVAEVAQIRGTDGFAAALAEGRADIATDRAVLTLTAPVTSIAPLPVAEPVASLPARLIGYRWDRPHALSDTGPCPAVIRGGVMTMTCRATFGNSGGPVVQQQDGVWRVVAVVSAIDARHTHAALAQLGARAPRRASSPAPGRHPPRRARPPARFASRVSPRRNPAR